jgi:hypothetical protein
VHPTGHGATLSTCVALVYLCSCNRCKQRITGSFVATHACPSPASFIPTANLCMPLDPESCGQRRCVLCKKPATIGKNHTCKSSALKHVHYDLSDLYPSSTWVTEPLAVLRNQPGHWVIVFSVSSSLPPRPNDFYRHHCYVATSTINNSGLGLYTVTGTTNQAGNPFIFGEGGLGKAGVPFLTKQMIGIYTGMPCKDKETSAQERIAMIEVGKGWDWDS